MKEWCQRSSVWRVHVYTEYRQYHKIRNLRRSLKRSYFMITEPFKGKGKQDG